MIRQEFQKWRQTIQISAANFLAYKGDVLLQIVAPAIVFFLIKFQLWSSIYGLTKATEIQGYSFDVMIEYQALVMLVGFLSQSYNSRSLAEDIRLGRITAYLLYPFEFWQFHAGRFIAFQIIQLILVTLTTVIFVSFGVAPSLTFENYLLGIFFTSLVGTLWFIIYFTLGILAFWLEETWMLRVTFLIITQFLSGAVLPLELFPKFLQDLLHLSPFPYMTYVPVKIFMGTYSGSILYATSQLLIWMVIVSFIARYVWKKGIGLYTAAGM